MSKRTYVVRKLLIALVMWFAITIGSFLAIGCVTESSIDRIVNYLDLDDWSDGNETKPFLRHKLGLDQPIYIRYLRWMGLIKQVDGTYRGVFQGDLGYSIWEEDQP
jgi:peptide/nickel transport system permease protein